MMIEITLAAGGIFAADQLTKAAIAGRLPPGQCWTVGAHLKIRHQRNEHLPNLFFGRTGLVAAWILVVSGALLLAHNGYFFHNPAARLSLGAALGGSASNVWDRLRLGGVVDFIDLSWWPVFNLADLAITIGTTLALYFSARA